MSQQEVNNQQINTLLDQLTSDSEKARIKVAEELIRIYPEIDDSDSRIEVGKAVLNAIGDKSWSVRQVASLILPHIYEAWAAEPLVNALEKFSYPVFKDGKIIKKCFEEIGKALVRVGTPALEPMINFYLTNKGLFKRSDLLYNDPYYAQVVQTYFESMGETAANTLISMLSIQQDDDRIFHLLINCGNAAQKPLLEFIKKQGIPLPTFLFAKDNENMVFYGLGAAALLGNKTHAIYKSDFEARLDKAQGSLAIPKPKLGDDYKELFHGKNAVSPAMLTLVALQMEDCKQYRKEHYQEAIISVLKQIGTPALNVFLQESYINPYLLGELGDPSAIEPLANALSLPNTKPERRNAVIYGLGRIGGANIPEIILPYLKDTERSVRETTAKVLGNLKDRQTTEALLVALNDKEWQVRLEAAVALGKIGDPRAVPGLIERLGDKGGKMLGMGKGVREYAAEALEQIGTPEALNAFKDRKLNKR